MRHPVIGIAPVLSEVERDLGISSFQAGILVSLPLLCFGVGTPVAAMVARHIPLVWLMSVGLAGVVVGSAIRSFGSFEIALVGAFVVGAALTLLNLGVPTWIGRDYFEQTALATGLQSAGTTIGTAVVSAAIIPTAALVGWRWGLVLWGLTAAIALVAWIAVARRAAVASGSAPVAFVDEARPIGVELTRFRLGVMMALITVAFFGHILGFYAMSTWLPPFLVGVEGLGAAEAGFAVSLFHLLGASSLIVVPILRRVSMTACAVLFTLSWTAFPFGIIAAPDWWLIWVVLGGLGQGASFTVIWTIAIRSSLDPRRQRLVAATVLTVAYTFAAGGPIILGLARDLTDSANAPFIIAAIVLAGMTVSSIAASRLRDY